MHSLRFAGLAALLSISLVGCGGDPGQNTAGYLTRIADFGERGTVLELSPPYKCPRQPRFIEGWYNGRWYEPGCYCPVYLTSITILPPGYPYTLRTVDIIVQDRTYGGWGWLGY